MTDTTQLAPPRARRPRAVVGSALVSGVMLASAACGSSGDGKPPTITAQDAAVFVADTIPQATAVTALTSANDDNHLLGRPNGYAAATVITDSRGQCSDGPGVDCGAVVEQWSSNAAAQSRATYIQGILKASPALGSEWDTAHGDLLLRVSGTLTPDAAAAYKTAFLAAKPGAVLRLRSAPSTPPPTVSPKAFNVGGWLGGNASPHYAVGQPGKVSVVAVGRVIPGPAGGATVPFAFRNNTPATISHVDWAGSASLHGRIVGSGSSQGTIPAQVQPGEIGLAYLFFDGGTIPANASFTMSATSERADTSSYNTGPLKVTQANVSGGSIAGSAKNTGTATQTGPYDVEVYCFTGSTIIATTTGFADQQGEIAPGGTVTFSVTPTTSCPSYVVGVSGFFK